MKYTVDRLKPATVKETKRAVECNCIAHLQEEFDIRSKEFVEHMKSIEHDWCFFIPEKPLENIGLGMKCNITLEYADGKVSSSWSYGTDGGEKHEIKCFLDVYKYLMNSLVQSSLQDKTPKKRTIFKIMQAIKRRQEIQDICKAGNADPSGQAHNDITWLNEVLEFENARPEEDFKEEDVDSWLDRAMERSRPVRFVQQVTE